MANSCLSLLCLNFVLHEQGFAGHLSLLQLANWTILPADCELIAEIAQVGLKLFCLFAPLAFCVFACMPACRPAAVLRLAV